MKHIFKWDKKYVYWGITAFCVIAASILFYMALSYLPLIQSEIDSLLRILNPFIWGLVIAYLLLPLERTLQHKLLEPIIKKISKKNWKNISRGIAVLLAEIIMVVVVFFVVYMIIPQLYISIKTIVDNSSYYVSTTTTWLEGVLINYPEIEEFILPKVQDLNTNLISWVQTTILPGLGNVASSLTTGVVSAVKGVYNLVIGIIVSIYILYSKTLMSANAKKLCYSLFSVENSKKIFAGLRFVDRTFMGFINGKLLDSLIIGIICYISCALLRMPYALLVSFIVGITNIIPFFGPFIGAIPSTLIILLADPLKSLIFIGFILVLQQVDGNIIGPRILGNSVGISGFWVMFAIILGAGLFGFWGMLLGVPVFSVIYAVFTNLVNNRLKRNGLPVESASYIGVDHIDPATYEPVMQEKYKQADEKTEKKK